MGRFCRLMRFRSNWFKDLQFFERGQMICYFCILPIWVPVTFFVTVKLGTVALLVAPANILILFMKGKFDVYFLCPLDKKLIFVMVASSTVCDLMVNNWLKSSQTVPNLRFCFIKNSSPRNLCKKSLTSNKKNEAVTVKSGILTHLV